jgi:hypothetical protein
MRILAIAALAAWLGRAHGQAGCAVPAASRVSCGVTGLASGLYPTEAECLDRGCCYDGSAPTPNCYFPGGGAVNITDVIIVQACHFDVRGARETRSTHSLAAAPAPARLYS